MHMHVTITYVCAVFRHPDILARGGGGGGGELKFWICEGGAVHLEQSKA